MTDTYHIFKDECERALGVYDVVQDDDVGVLQLLQQAGLPDGGEGGSLLLLKPDLLQRHRLLRQADEEKAAGSVTQGLGADRAEVKRFRQTSTDGHHSSSGLDSGKTSRVR